MLGQVQLALQAASPGQHLNICACSTVIYNSAKSDDRECRYLAAVKAAAVENRRGRLPEYHAKAHSGGPKSNR